MIDEHGNSLRWMLWGVACSILAVVACYMPAFWGVTIWTGFITLREMLEHVLIRVAQRLQIGPDKELI